VCLEGSTKPRIYNLTPKRPNVRRADKPVLGSVTLSHTIFKISKTFGEDASRSKLRGSTKIIFSGPTDQKLWVFENLKRSMGRAGMCWSQPARVEYMSPKRWAIRIRNLEKSPLNVSSSIF
jgi:hypothetical protein